MGFIRDIPAYIISKNLYKKTVIHSHGSDLISLLSENNLISMAAKRVLRGTTIVVPSQHVRDALIWTSLDIRVVENFSSMKMGKIKFDGTPSVNTFRAV